MEQALLSNDKVAEITRSALKKVLPKTQIKDVEVAQDAFASDDLKITVVVAGGSVVNLSGAQLAKIHELVTAELWEKKDERFPYLRYLTAKEVKQLAS